MSLESLKQLILGEASKEADKIIADAKQKAQEIKRESEASSNERIAGLQKEFERKHKTLEAMYQSKQSSFQKSAELSAVHAAVDSAVARSCDILLTNSEIRDSIRNWTKKMTLSSESQNKETHILQIGKRIDESLPEVRDIAKKSRVSVEVCRRDYALVYVGAGFNEVLDLVTECRRVVDENMAEYVAILKNTQP